MLKTVVLLNIFVDFQQYLFEMDSFHNEFLLLFYVLAEQNINLF